MVLFERRSTESIHKPLLIHWRLSDAHGCKRRNFCWSAASQKCIIGVISKEFDMRCPAILPLLVAVFVAPAVGTIEASTAQYRVTFNSTWNSVDHPYDFPVGNAHFSSLIGGTHNANVTFWQPGELASSGIEIMAERGGTSPLAAEVQTAITAGTALSVISGGRIDSSPGMATATFQMRDDFPLVTLVSMVAPSPDWFVGVTAMPMRPSGRWLDRAVVDLWPYDSGTDHGVTFTSADIEAEPHVPIAQITGFPFAGTPPLGTFTFELLSVTSIPGDANGDNRVDRSDIAIL